MPTIPELVKQVADAAASPEDREILVRELQRQAQPVFQIIFDKGHSDATTRTKPKLDDLEAKLTTRDAELKTERENLKTLKAEKPDLAKIHADYQTTIADLTNKSKQETEALKGQVATERLSRAKSDLKSDLTAKGVDPIYADVLAERTVAQNRIRFTADGKTEVMAQGKEIPLTPGEGKTAIGLLAEELHATVDPRFILSRADSGSGLRGTVSIGAAGSKAAFYAEQRKQVKEKYGTGEARPSGASALNERMGGRKSA